MSTIKRLFIRRICLFVFAAAATNFVVPTAAARDKPSYEDKPNYTEVVESDNPNAPPSPPRNREASTLDNLMGSDQIKPSNATEAMSKAAFFAEFERDYLANSNGDGHFSHERYDKVADDIAIVLPVEFGVSAACVQAKHSGDGRISGTSHAMTIAAAMYDVIGKIVPSKRNDGHMLRDHVNSLSQLGSGCPTDFPAIKQFLSEYSDFAKGMVDRKLTLVAEKKVKEREQAQQVKIAADQQANEKANKEREAQSREAEMLRQKKEADTNRAKKLLSGIEKPVSFGDYMLMYPSEYGTFLFTHPKLNADNKMYLLRGSKLDREESDGLVVKSSDNSYIMVKRTRSTTIFGDLQINWPIAVIGKYVGNTQYTTVIGAVKTAAVIEAIVIAKEPVQY